MAGRKSNLMQAVEHDLIVHLQSGLTVKDACALVGIDQDTFTNWCKQHSDFSESATRARVQGRQMAVLVIRRAVSDGDVNAAQWYLERTDPEHWGKRTYHYHQFEVFRKFCEERKLSAGDMLELYMQELAAVDNATSSSTEGSTSG